MRALADMAEGDGFAGLDAHLPEFYLADFGEHLLHHVVVADRGAATGDDEVKAAIRPDLMARRTSAASRASFSACGPRLGPIGEIARTLQQCAQGRRVVTHGAAIAD